MPMWGGSAGSGSAGADGASAYEIAVAHGFNGSEEEWLASLEGPAGQAGSNGLPGTGGEDGLSAYEVAVLSGFNGTVSEWLASLEGPQGQQGPQGVKGDTGDQGIQGQQGPQGIQGVPGPAMWDTTVLTSADRSTTSLTAVDIPDLSIALAANRLYEFEAVLIVNSSSTAGCKAAVNYSAAGAVGSWINLAEGNATLVSTAQHALNTLPASAFAVATGFDAICIIRGFIKTGANAGNLTAKQAKVTSGTSIVRKNSLLRVRLVGSN